MPAENPKHTEAEARDWAVEKGLRVTGGVDPGHVEAHREHKHRKATTPKPE